MQFTIAAMGALLLHLVGAEEIHLVNCDSESAIMYFGNGVNANSYPAPSNICHPNPGAIQMWEGQRTVCSFSTGITVAADVNTIAQQAADFSYVGEVRNGFKVFSCYKDDKHNMFNGHDCKSIYYCLP